MRFSEKWLREWVDPDISTTEFAEQLTMAGLEVEVIEPVTAPFKGVVVGEVLSAEPHPDAGKLRVCKVDVGDGSIRRIVCGAPRVEPGWRIPTALIGAELAAGVKIKRAKLRGIESQGMLCSPLELGLGDSGKDLLVLPADTLVGDDVWSIFHLDDVSIELALTPNRGDCLSIAGLAREVGVLNRCPVNRPQIAEVEPVLTDIMPVKIEALDGCPRYVGRVIRGIDACAITPLWMRERLRRSGLRALNPVVDVTNYVMLELGQPMHAFDLDKISDGIKVRNSRIGEEVELLDGQRLILGDDTLVIADHSRVQALAGIMGGARTAVQVSSTDIFLESAYFNARIIAGGARKYRLHTDSSHRFERGVDPELQRLAMERATALLLAVVGGQAGPIVEVRSEQHIPKRLPILLRRERMRNILGMEIADDQTQDILLRLGMDVDPVAQGWEVVAPGYRPDVTIEVDLIEEIVRIHGYQQIPSVQAVTNIAMRPRPEAEILVKDLAQVLINRGYQEVITYSFVDPKLQVLLDPENSPITLENPISADLSVMRTNLWPGLLQALMHNVKRQQGRVRLFEHGLKFSRQDTDIQQERVLAGLVYGDLDPEQWGVDARGVDFFDCKADVEALLSLTGLSQDYRFSSSQHAALHPGQSARIKKDQQTIGWLGALNPSIGVELGLDSGVYLFELDLVAIEHGSVAEYRELSRFPSIRRDLSIVVDTDKTFNEVRECVFGVVTDILLDLQLFDLYTGEGIDFGRKSLALGLTFQDLKRTLRDSEIDSTMKELIAELQNKLGASLRG